MTQKDWMQSLLKDGVPAEIVNLFSVASGILEAGAVFDAGKPDATSDVNMHDGRKLRVTCATWNTHVAARRAADKALRAWRQCDGKAKGEAYWASRGIAVGEKVVGHARHMLNPFAALRVVGIAKVGIGGAYVSSEYQRGKLSPDAFGKDKPEQQAA